MKQNPCKSHKIKTKKVTNPITQRILKLNKSEYNRCEVCGYPAKNILDLREHIKRKHPGEDYNIDPLRHIRAHISKKDYTAITMGELFGKKITSSHNQHVLLQIVGKTGTGKSNAALYIATKTAEYVAKKMGGKPEDYFTIDNCAIMELDSIIPVMKEIDKKRYNIFILDDIGASYGARDYQNKVNKAFNKILQTFRDSNTLVIFTMPDQMLIDKVPRKLAHYNIEMTTQIYHKKLSMGKLFEVKELYKSGKTIYPFIQENGIKYVRALFRLVDGDLHDEYERRRAIIRKKMTADCIDVIEDPEEHKEKRVFKYQAIAGDVSKLQAEDPKISMNGIAKKLGCDRGTVAKAINYNNGKQ